MRLERRNFLKRAGQGVGVAFVGGHLGALAKPRQALASEPADLGGMSLVTVNPGVNVGATINSTLAAGNAVQLIAADYSLETALVVPTGGKIYGAGSGLTRMYSSFTPSTSLADSATNALILAQGTVSGTPTSLAASAQKDSMTITVASATGITAGAWLCISGNNLNDDLSGHGDTTQVIKTEIVKVASSYTSGTTIPLAFPLSQHHGAHVSSPSSVRLCAPVQDIVLQGFDIAQDGKTVAVGALFDYANRVTVRDVSGAGLSRALINARLGTRNFRLDVYSRGENNSIVYLDSAMIGDVTVNGAADGARFHTYGNPRGGLVCRQRVTDVKVRGTFQNLCTGISIWGGFMVYVEDVAIRNCDLTERLSRDSEAGYGISLLAPAIDVNCSTTTYKEWTNSCRLGNVLVENCRHPSQTAQSCVVIVNSWNFRVDALTFVSTGAAPASGAYMNGLYLYDCFSGTAGTIYARGVEYPLRTGGFGAKWDIEYFGVTFMPTASTSAIEFNHHAYYASNGPRIKTVRFENLSGSGGVRFGTSYMSNPDYMLAIDRMEIENEVFTNVRPAYNSSAVSLNRYDIVTIDGSATAGRFAVTTAAGANSKNAVAVTGLGAYPYDPAAPGAVILVSVLPTSNAVVNVPLASAINIGDLLEANGSRQAVVNASPSNKLNLLGVATSKKASGTGTKVSISQVR